jgi:hypothetical protein
MAFFMLCLGTVKIQKSFELKGVRMRLSFIIVLALAVASCATRYINPTTVQNPPPAETFSAFGQFELKPVSLAPAYSGDNANQRAAARIQDHFNRRVSPVIEGWNRATPQGQSVRILLIEPRIEHIKFIGGAARFWVGPIPGSSAVIMKVKYSDKASGKLISEPEFFQRAAAWSGAFTVGGQDNAMLGRVVTLVADYTNGNYKSAVGGPSGATDELVNATD